MSISTLVLNGAIQHQSNLSILKHNADSKGETEQSQITSYLNKSERNKSAIVEFSNKAKMQQQKQDAKEKGKNEYHGDGGRERKQEQNTGIYYEDWDEGPKKLVMLRMPVTRPLARFDLKV